MKPTCERHGFRNRRGAKVPEPEIDEIRNPCLLSLQATPFEHLCRHVDADHSHAGPRDRNGNSARTNAELDDSAAAHTSPFDVERHIVHF
jgi:hypothetical protein